MSQPSYRLLVVDDDDLIHQSIRMAVQSQWSVTSARSPDEIKTDLYDAAFVDMHLTGDLTNPQGLGVIKKLSTHQAHLEIVAISGDLDRNLMEAGLKAGASRFLSKPLSAAEICLILEKIEALKLLQSASTRQSTSQTAWLGESRSSQDIRRQIAALKGESGPILIEGESGTGKEVVARLIHEQELRRPFLTINVAAIPENLFESEFFGHTKGSFTGADQNKMGLAEAAHGGDLFLDEIETLPLHHQAKLLRFLENGEIRRVGSKEPIRVHTRVIAATNQKLEKMISEGKFREDLLWRLGGKKIFLPPLRERVEDISALSNSFIDKERPRRNKQLSSDGIKALMNYSWPGNVRELKRVIEQLCLTSPIPIIRAEDVNQILTRNVTGNTSLFIGEVDLSIGLDKLMENFEKEMIRRVLARESDIDLASQTLNMSRSNLYKKIKDYQISME